MYLLVVLCPLSKGNQLPVISYQLPVKGKGERERGKGKELILTTPDF
jgi:hypothetical protein